ncbi:hypothetical protein J2800_001048 [Caulobacter rhizosphaerae]|uniref:AbiV family abortive infection protein n=1 Tax=Caulobacter rhizosphaerae TaxID=2010972 RepID=A0ABU1MVU7_9CAUL|nr:DUF5677 domain-containing protein [Caulobacter rhizosphaerae]MDR6530312.1 hypothetical protein [Caulobacter rhizosphaerae]
MSDNPFVKNGFLADAASEWIADYRAANAAWFTLATDLSEILQEVAFLATEQCHGTSFERDTVAAFLLLRGLQTFQGAVVMAERGMAVESRILTRSLLEDAFCMAGLHDNPDDLLKMIRDDHDASRKGKAKVILHNGIEGADARALNDLIKEIQGVSYFSPEAASKLGPLKRQYLLYKQISDDAAHPSANSLKRHMNVASDRSGWNYRWGPNTDEEIKDALNAAILCAIPLGVAITQMLDMTELNSKLGDVAEQYRKLAFHSGEGEG